MANVCEKRKEPVASGYAASSRPCYSPPHCLVKSERARVQLRAGNEPGQSCEPGFFGVRRQAKRDAALDLTAKPLLEIPRQEWSRTEGGVALRLPPHSTSVMTTVLRSPTLDAR